MHGPTPFTLFTNDLPTSVTSATLHMYADDRPTTIYCIGATADIGIAQLNIALNELYTVHAWCLYNRLTPHPRKSEVMVLARGTTMGTVALVYRI